MNIDVIEFNDKEYPKRLKNICDPPKRLFVLGNKKILNRKGVAIVGSRDCSEKGKDNARFFASEIANVGFNVISGMAKGIDTAAHLGALSVNGNTIAVLGCGVDYVYPYQNIELYNQIIDSGGAIVSEYPNGTEPTSEFFRRRNRIVSGLSLGVLVVEAEHRSGTTITANFAKSQGKEVFCIPNAIDNNKGIGTNMLIQKGATLVIQPNEIIDKYLKGENHQLTIENVLRNKEMIRKKIKEEYKNIYECLERKPLGINELGMFTRTSMTELYQKLFAMELEGIIEFKQNKYIIKTS